MNNMHMKGSSFLVFGGQLFNVNLTNIYGPKVSDPVVMLYDIFDNTDTTYSSEAIEKLKNKQINYEF